MSKFKLALIVVMLAAFTVPAMAGDKVVKRVPTGAVAFHFVGDLSYITGELVGYVAFIEGVDGPLFNGVPSLFNGDPSEDTAYFTLRLTKLTPPPIFLPPVPDPDLNVQLIMPGGQFTVYFDSSPSLRDWNDPDTFSRGVPIAVFDESAILSTGASGAAFNTFSSRLIDSTRINFNGQRIDFKKLVPNGVTVTNFGNGPRSIFPPGANFGGTAIAIGWKPGYK